MTTSAHAVAAALRERVPGLPTKKLHKLLYYCQGHHLATFGEPLFRESISAWDMGPVVGQLWFEEKERLVPGDAPPLDEAALNTVGYVVSRYGRLSGNDLERLTHTEPPWQRADRDRRPRTSAKIQPEWLREYFASARDDDDDEEPAADAEAVAAWLAGAGERLAEPVRPDDLDELRARLGAP
ncbi:MAG TPA: type II toxin-antitoxin system antitoxin SocA domain-containing protein [Mycobacteriales bacterium]|jgi:uncharacterized phage-associated protein|nr:type II toxin-antitoxin system antitoxin SocA domain-containing protein [Mycobacteriales bacterium]